MITRHSIQDYRTRTNQDKLVAPTSKRTTCQYTWAPRKNLGFCFVLCSKRPGKIESQAVCASISSGNPFTGDPMEMDGGGARATSAMRTKLVFIIIYEHSSSIKCFKQIMQPKKDEEVRMYIKYTINWSTRTHKKPQLSRNQRQRKNYCFMSSGPWQSVTTYRGTEYDAIPCELLGLHYY